MATYRYPVHETVNGVTLVFNGPDKDPVAADGPKHHKDKEGWIEDFFVWRAGDASATHRLYIIGTSGNEIKVRARRTDEDLWDYTIYSGGKHSGRFWRTRDGGSTWDGGDPGYPVSDLRIKLADEAEEYAVEQVKKSGDEQIRIEHQGSNCSLVWNPSTRRYTRKC